jgi:hypothetical protein
MLPIYLSRGAAIEGLIDKSGECERGLHDFDGLLLDLSYALAKDSVLACQAIVLLFERRLAHCLQLVVEVLYPLSELSLASGDWFVAGHLTVPS